MKATSHSILTLLLSTTIGHHAWGQFAASHDFGPTGNVFYTTALDVDEDGDLDVVASDSGSSEVVWFPNDGLGGFGSRQVLAAVPAGLRQVLVVDIDGDGDSDLLTASANGQGQVSLVENLGQQAFAPASSIGTAGTGTSYLATADLDADGDLDVAATAYDASRVVWLENLGNNMFGPAVLISTASAGPSRVACGDIDLNGHVDVLVCSYVDDEISWYPNGGGAAFGNQRTISASADGVLDVALADLDGDGRVDVVAVAALENDVLSFMNLGNGNFSAERVADDDAPGVRRLVVEDIDLDGLLDVLVICYGPQHLRLYRNSGFGGFLESPVALPSWGNLASGYYLSLQVADFDGDQDLDVVMALDQSDRHYFYRNVTPVGVVYCTSTANSTGAISALIASGTAHASQNRLALTALDLPPSSFGYFLTSTTAGSVNQPGNSQGVLCLGGAIGRYTGPGQLLNSTALRRFTLVLDLTRTPTPTGLVSAAAGSTWHFQAWHRDLVAGVVTSNLTEALRVAFL